MTKFRVLLDIMIEENKFLEEIKCMIEILKKENSSEEKRKAHKFLDQIQQKKESICHLSFTSIL